MGEMADYALDEVLDEEDARTDYLLGNMPEHEAYEAGIIDELGNIYHDTQYQPSLLRRLPRRAAAVHRPCSIFMLND